MSDKKKEKRIRSPPTPTRALKRRPQTHRERYVAWLNQLQKPNQTLIKKETNSRVPCIPMLPAKAELLLAVYDGFIPASPEHRLNVLLQELPRNPRKGTIHTWQISDA
jgi:hypothetical protein